MKRFGGPFCLWLFLLRPSLPSSCGRNRKIKGSTLKVRRIVSPKTYSLPRTSSFWEVNYSASSHQTIWWQVWLLYGQKPTRMITGVCRISCYSARGRWWYQFWCTVTWPTWFLTWLFPYWNQYQTPSKNWQRPMNTNLLSNGTTSSLKPFW